MNKWYQNQGSNSDVVLYSKVRLARNVADAAFPSRLNSDMAKSLCKKIWATVKSSSVANDYNLITLADMSDVKAVSYAEKQLISPQFAKQKASSFILSSNQDVSIMLCEEDHIRINTFEAGQSLDTAYAKAQVIDDIFISNLNIAFSKDYGFLTASPINLGTALKASFALHLPALSHQNSIYKLSTMVSKLGLSLRPLNKDSAGDVFVLSNLVSLGITEQASMENLNAICTQIVNQERSAREMLKQDEAFEDKIYRTLGILKMARQIDVTEFSNCISLVRLGVSLGYFDISYKTIGDMVYSLQDATLLDSADAPLNQQMCNKLRANLIREKLG